MFPFLEVETSVRVDRVPGPRIRCSFCFRNKPQAVKRKAKKRSFNKLLKKEEKSESENLSPSTSKSRRDI